MATSAVRAAHVAIETRIEDQWGTTTPISWPNVDFNPPSDGEWLEVSILWGDGFIDTMASTSKNRLVGIVQLDLYGPKGDALDTLLTKADTARDILDRWTGSGVSFFAPSPPNLIDHDTYARLSIRIPFHMVD